MLKRSSDVSGDLLGPFSRADIERARYYLRAQFSPATLRAYRSDWRRFESWCRGRGLVALPADPAVVVVYLSDEADAGRKLATLRRRLAAIRFVHLSRDLPSPSEHPEVRAVVRGIARAHGSAQQGKRALLGETLRQVIDDIDATTPAGRRDRALLLLGFAAALRRSELVAVRVSHLVTHPEGLLLHLPRSKTDQAGHGGSVPVLRDGGDYCPVAALEAWLSVASIVEGTVFRRVYRGGRVDEDAARHLSPYAVALIVKRRAAAVGLDAAELAGHSLRSGFITTAAEAGKDLFKIMDVSRHRDPRTVMRYLQASKRFEAHAAEGLLNAPSADKPSDGTAG